MPVFAAPRPNKNSACEIRLLQIDSKMLFAYGTISEKKSDVDMKNCLLVSCFGFFLCSESLKNEYGSLKEQRDVNST